MKLGSNLEGVERCPQCGIAHPHLAYRSHVLIPYQNSTKGFAWIVYQCGSCYNVVCAKGVFDHARLAQHAVSVLATSPSNALAVIPESKNIDKDLPDKPRKYLEQAISSLHAPDGAIMLAGSSIDAMLKIKGYLEGTVYSRIEAAVKDHVLTHGMKDWAHAVRLESNKPRHADLDAPHATTELAKQTIKFAEALGEYLFALPARIERGKNASIAATSDES